VERLANADPRTRDAILMFAYTGMRFSEIAGLKAKYVDLERKRVRVEEVVVELDDGSLHWKGPKDYERRSIALTDFLVELLVARLNSRSPDDLMFPSAEGAVMRNSNFRRDGFDAAVKTAALSPLTPHELRHTAASMAISAGANVLAVQRMLGHEKPSTTLNTYSDLFDTDLEDVANALGRMRNSVLVDETWMESNRSGDFANLDEPR
jgi:integrase